MSPFQPKQAEPTVKRLAVETTFPILEEALRWLLTRGILTPKEVAGFPEEAKLKARTMSQVQGAPAIADLNAAVKESMAAGEGAELWRERVGKIANFQEHLSEVVQRTATHRAYIEGQEEVIRSAALEDTFEFWQYFATDDGRGRATHVALNEKVFHRDSPMGRLSSKLLAEWNCRCTRTALTREDAEEIGIEPGQEGPPPKVRKERPKEDEVPLAGFVLM